MRRLDKRQTATTFIQRIGREYGRTVTRTEAGYIAWNQTGYPSFWDGDPWETFDRQVTDFFVGIGHSEDK